MTNRRLADTAPYALLAVMVGILLATRVHQARESLWLDELHSAWVAMGSLGEVGPRSAMGNQSPLYFGVLWILTRLLGPSEVVLRAPSIVAGAITAVLLFRVAHRWTGSPWIALLPAWLATVDPGAIHFGTEARPYALVSLAAVLHMAVVARLVERPSVLHRAAFVGGLALLFHLHYTAAIVLTAELAFLLIVRLVAPTRTRYRARWLVTDLGLAALAMLPALPGLAAVVARRANWESFVPQGPPWMAPRMVSWGWIAVLLALVVLTQATWRRLRHVAPGDRETTPWPTMTLALCWALVPLGAAWALTATDVARVLHPRYVIVSAPAALLCVTLTVGIVRARGARIILGAGTAVLAIWSGGILRTVADSGRLVTNRTDDWRGAVAHLNRNLAGAGEPILLRSLLVETDALRDRADPALVEYSLYPLTSLYRVDVAPEDLVALPRTEAGHLTEPVRRRLAGSEAFWLVYGGGELGLRAAELRIEESLVAEAVPGANAGASPWRVVTRAAFGTVHVVRFERETAAPAALAP